VAGPAYRFGQRAERSVVDDSVQARLIDAVSADLLERYFPYTRAMLAARNPVAEVVLDGWVVSACFSARQRATACETGVATEVAYQGRGLAALVVAAWRDAVEKSGAEPLYSTSWDNLTSLAVARKLGMIAYAETFSLT
jgi:GNAT acetyltransferase-like protein